MDKYLHSAEYCRMQEHIPVWDTCFWHQSPHGWVKGVYCECFQRNQLPDSKIHGVNMGPTWGRQDPGGSHVGPTNLAIWAVMWLYFYHYSPDQWPMILMLPMSYNLLQCSVTFPIKPQLLTPTGKHKSIYWRPHQVITPLFLWSWLAIKLYPVWALAEWFRAGFWFIWQVIACHSGKIVVLALLAQIVIALHQTSQFHYFTSLYNHEELQIFWWE